MATEVLSSSFSAIKRSTKMIGEEKPYKEHVAFSIDAKLMKAFRLRVVREIGLDKGSYSIVAEQLIKNWVTRPGISKKEQDYLQ